LIPYPVDNDFVSGTQSMVNTPPLHHTPPITWRQNKANITKDVTKEMESEQPDVVDQDLLLAATRKIEAAAREHPGWSSVEATLADRFKTQVAPPRVDRNERGGYALQENMFPMARQEAHLQYQARASAQARQPTHYAPPDNLLKLHEQVLAKSAARAGPARRAHGSGKTTFGPSPVVGAKEGSHWDNNFNDHPTRRTSNALMGNGGRFEGGNLDLRFLDDVY
jgi:hypothetical protein